MKNVDNQELQELKASIIEMRVQIDYIRNCVEQMERDFARYIISKDNFIDLMQKGVQELVMDLHVRNDLENKVRIWDIEKGMEMARVYEKGSQK